MIRLCLHLSHAHKPLPNHLRDIVQKKETDIHISIVTQLPTNTNQSEALSRIPHMQADPTDVANQTANKTEHTERGESAWTRIAMDKIRTLTAIHVAQHPQRYVVAVKSEIEHMQMTWLHLRSAIDFASLRIFFKPSTRQISLMVCNRRQTDHPADRSFEEQ